MKGIHLANGPQDWEALVQMGFRCFTFLDGQGPEARHIRERMPGARLVMRLWSRNFLEWTPLELARRCTTFYAQEIIPWNEANLASETGGVQQSYTDLLLYWQEFQREFRHLCPDKLFHFPAWSPVDDARGSFWPGADAYDLHVYGDPLAMLTYIDRCLAVIPADKSVYISEWNFGIPWDDAPPEWIDTFLDGLAARPRVTGATAFIFRWDNPDPATPNYDLEGTAALRVLASWRPPGAPQEPPRRPPAIVSGGGVMDTDRIMRALDIVWGWAERLQQLSAEQAAQEIKDAVIAIKEEVLSPQP